MPFASEPDPNWLHWLDERRTDALGLFSKRVPARYATTIPLPDEVETWAAAGLGQNESLFLTGHIGVGKTHTAWTATRTWLAACFGQRYRRNPVIEIHRSTSLFDDLRPEGTDPYGTSKRAKEADLLFIDDLAAARVSPTGWTQERLYEIFDERYVQQRPVIMTCDVLPGDLGGIVGARVASRLAEMCADNVVFLEGGDRRTGGGE
ncbi:DnaA ATPase domain-containing protein [Streptomyces bugieae]|uniref:DnaA/Hda family protein n=1 Tax=Streptomyces bugieae TaxID=3098223 RepID=A0ABU7NL25_9ACTN|nr:DnaA/Hda family protein [Streptomyces sp. DSM 41528]